MSKLWRWQNGRQNQFYDKMLLLCIPKFMDCWLIKYSKGVGINWHTDPVEGKRHYRINIILKKGGEFWIDDKKGRRLINKRFIFFRPDIHKHCVKEIGEGQERLVLSIGWVLPDKEVKKC